MSDGIDQAADAFLSDLGGAPKSSNSRDSGKDTPPERMDFGGLEDSEGEVADVDDPEALENSEDDPEDTGDGEDGANTDEEADEADDEESEEDEEEADDEGNLDLKTAVRVKVDGEEREVPLKEALEGYIRTETFHKRLNQVHEAAQTVEREAGEVSKSRQRYSELLDSLTEQLDSLAPKEPNWDELARTDPKAAYEQRVAWDRYKEQRAALEGEKARVKEEEAEANRTKLIGFIRSERVNMLKAHPEWNDDKVRGRDMNSMARTAKAAGFSEDEINTIYDHRMMTVLLKASKYDRIMAAKPKAKNGQQPGNRNAKTGAGASRTAPKVLNRASKRLAQTGSVDAAASVFNNLLGAEERRSRRK